MERIEIKSAPTGPDAPVESVVQTVPDTETATVTSDARPAWLPERFNTPEDLAKAYAELESHVAQKAPPPKAKDAATDGVQDIVESAGLAMTELTSEYEQSGRLSDDSYDKLAKIGVSREYVDGYIRGQEALARQYQADVYTLAGGESQYADMTQWAATHLTPAEIHAFNASVNSGNLEQAKLSVRGLMARYTASEGSEPTLVKGIAANDPTSVYRSTAELVAAMKDPKYKTDPAYRQDVIEKLGRSSVF